MCMASFVLHDTTSWCRTATLKFIDYNVAMTFILIIIIIITSSIFFKKITIQTHTKYVLIFITFELYIFLHIHFRTSK